MIRLNKNYFKHFNDGVAMEWNNGIPSIRSYIQILDKFIWISRSTQEKINQKHEILQLLRKS